MWLQMGEDEGAPLVYFKPVKHMWVGYADCRSGTVGEDEEAGEREAKAKVLTARKCNRTGTRRQMKLRFSNHCELIVRL